MAYCLYTDVESEFKSLDSTASGAAVSSTEIGGFIDQASALIDAYLVNRYQIPITGTSALLLIQWIAVQIVKERIIKVLAIRTGVQEPDQLEAEKPQWQIMLEALQKGGLDLTDGTLLSSGDGIKSGNVENNITQTFKVEKQQW